MNALQQMTTSGDGLVGRPNVLALVAPTTIRFLVLIGALLSAGLFMGTWLHNESPVGDDWARRVAECHPTRSSRPSSDWLAQVQARQQCTASVERRRFAFALGGACLTLVAGITVVLTAPRVIERRRGLHPVGPGLAPAVDKFQAFADEAGVVRRTALVVGSARLRDAFSYGVPGRYRVAVPPAILVRWRDSTTFDPLIRHELAHVRHHDVPLAWMARSMWVVVVPLLALPVVWGLLSRDPSAIPSYLWRAAMLTVVTLLASSALLRSREHGADLRASPTPESAAELSTLLHRISTPSRRGVRKLLAYHPSGEDRLTIVDGSGRHAAVTFVDGLTAAFLAGLTLPLLIGVISTVNGELAFVVAGIVVGPLVGATVGLGLWRQSLVQRITGGHVHVAPVALGVLVGSALGLAVSLAQTGSESVGEYNRLVVNALTPVAVCGATVIAAGLASCSPMPRHASGHRALPGSAALCWWERSSPLRSGLPRHSAWRRIRVAGHWAELPSWPSSARVDQLLLRLLSPSQAPARY
jgi:Zn-dependent protease with chaperone function